MISIKSLLKINAASVCAESRARIQFSFADDGSDAAAALRRSVENQHTSLLSLHKHDIFFKIARVLAQERKSLRETRLYIYVV